MRFQATLEIKAPAETVWRTLMDFKAYSDWNPFVVYAASNDRRTVSINLDIAPDERYLGLEVRIEKIRAPHYLRGKLLYGPPGLLGGCYTLRIDQQADRILVSHEVTLNGLLRPVYVSKRFAAAAQSGLEAMNAALEKRCLRG